MNTLDAAVKNFACGFAALAISAVLSWSLVESTNTAPFAIKPVVIERMAKSLPRTHYLATHAPQAAASSARA